MQNTLVEFTDKDIIVVENEKTIYILGNTILGTEPIYDDFGNIKEMVPMYNLTIICSDFLETKRDDNILTFITKIPKLRILRPDLCTRILPDA